MSAENAITRLRRRDGKATTAAEVLRRVQVGIDNHVVHHAHTRLDPATPDCDAWTCVLTDPDTDLTEAIVTVRLVDP